MQNECDYNCTSCTSCSISPLLDNIYIDSQRLCPEVSLCLWNLAIPCCEMKDIYTNIDKLVELKFEQIDTIKYNIFVQLLKYDHVSKWTICQLHRELINIRNKYYAQKHVEFYEILVALMTQYYTCIYETLISQKERDKVSVLYLVKCINESKAESFVPDETCIQIVRYMVVFCAAVGYYKKHGVKSSRLLSLLETYVRNISRCYNEQQFVIIQKLLDAHVKDHKTCLEELVVSVKLQSLPSQSKKN